MPPKGSRTAPLSNEADAARKREKCGAEARAQEKVALQSEARAFFVATVGEAHQVSELRAHLHRARRPFFSSVALMSSDAPVPADGMFEQLD